METRQRLAFDTRGAAHDFVEVAAEVLRIQAARDHKAAQEQAEKQLAHKAFLEKRRRDQIAEQILIDEELAAWEQWDGISREDEDAVRDRAMARDGGIDHLRRLWQLEEKAKASPDFQTVFAARLAESEDVLQQRRRQRIEKQAQRERERPERERKQFRERRERLKAELLARQSQRSNDQAAGGFLC